MRVALLASESNPMDADLEKVLPGVNERLNAQHSLLVGFQQHVDHKIDRLTETVATGFDRVASLTENWKEETDKIIGCTLVEAGNNLLRNPPMSPGAASTASTASTNAGTDASNRNTQEKRQEQGQQTSRQSSPENHCRYRMQMKHPSLASVWREWFGLEEFEDEYGGINGRNKMFKAKWRQHLNGTSYSKVSQLIKGVNAYAVSNRLQPEAVIAEWEGIFTACKHSVNNMVKALQDLGKLKKLKQRGRVATPSQ
jgi:ribosome assembly protein YihI (activator of Der GTPase)